MCVRGSEEKVSKMEKCIGDKGLKVNIEKVKVMVCVSEGEVMCSQIDPCGICGKRVTVNLLLCTNSWKVF